MTSGLIRSYRGDTAAAVLEAYAFDAEQAARSGWIPTGQAWADSASEHVLLVTYARRPGQPATSTAPPQGASRQLRRA